MYLNNVLVYSDETCELLPNFPRGDGANFVIVDLYFLGHFMSVRSDVLFISHVMCMLIKMVYKCKTIYNNKCIFFTIHSLIVR